MISSMDSRYPISLIKIDSLTLELLPLFWYRQLLGKTYISFFVWWSSYFIKVFISYNCHYTHQPPLGWGQKVIWFSFLKVVMLHIKIKWKKCRPTCKVTLWIYTLPWPLGLGLKVRYWSCADVSILFIKLSTITYLTGVCYDLNDTEGELRVR